MAAHPVSPLKLFATGLYLLIWPVLIIFLSGDFHWLEGWLFSTWLVALCTTVIAWLYRHDPALLAERYRAPGSGGQKSWDQLVVALLLIGFISWIVLMPLDARRFGWTRPFPVAVKILGGALLGAAAFLLLRAFVDNTFLSPLVRVQEERAQRVVSTGVYGFVRHPMYLGAIAMFVGAPLLMSSRAGLAAGGALSLLIALRTLGEEKLLIEKLDGYADYRKQVRWRLFPFIW